MKEDSAQRKPSDITTGPNVFTNEDVTSVNIYMDGVVMEMEGMDIDAVRVGNTPGEAPSFRGMYIKNMRTEISGDISIWGL